MQRESDRSLQSTRASEPSAWMDRLVVKTSTNMPDLPSCGSRLVVQTLTLLALPETELAELVNPPSANDGGSHAGGEGGRQDACAVACALEHAVVGTSRC